MSAREQLLEAGADALDSVNGDRSRFALRSDAAAALDAFLSDPAKVIAALVECEMCGGTGRPPGWSEFSSMECCPAPHCSGGVDTERRDACIKALGGEEAGWNGDRRTYAFPSPKRETRG